MHGSEPNDDDHTSTVAVTRDYHDDLVRSVNEYSKYFSMGFPFLFPSPLPRLCRVRPQEHAFLGADYRDAPALSRGWKGEKKTMISVTRLIGM